MAPTLFALSSVAACSLTSLDYLKTAERRDSAGAGGALGDDASAPGSGGATGDAARTAEADPAIDVGRVPDVAEDASILDVPGAGGVAATGGVAPGDGVVASGGAVSTGGVVATGGWPGTGGVRATGGAAPTGGVAASGGVASSGGRPGTGGAVATGGAAKTGGSGGRGGATGTGGTVATGGASGTGGCAACNHPIELTGESATSQHGDKGAGTSHKDRCPGDQVVIGYSGTLRDDVYSSSGVPVLQVSSMQALCGAVTVAQTGEVTVSSQGTLLQRGDAGTAGSWSRRCPTNQVVVGIYGRSGVIVDQIGFICAGLTGKVSGCAILLEIGKTTKLDPAGGTGGSAFSDSCPAGMVSSGQSLYSDQWINSFGLLCSTPTPSPECGP